MEKPEEAQEAEEAVKEKKTKIMVSNLPTTHLHPYKLQLFFENVTFGGWCVTDTKVFENEHRAIIQFSEPEAVNMVLDNRPIQIDGKNIDVEIYAPDLLTIEVKGPLEVINESQLPTLKLYFEAFRRSNGGRVIGSCFDAEQNIACITFETEEVARRVVEKSSHEVINQPITVQLHTPLIHKTCKCNQCNNWGIPGYEHHPVSKRAVSVNGYLPSKPLNKLEAYFQNKRFGGGGNVKIEYLKEDKTLILVTFENEEIAKNVISKTHKVEGCNLIVALYIPPKRKEFYHDRILIKGLNPTTTKECLFNYLEAKAACDPSNLIYHAVEEGTAVVTLKRLDFSKVEDAVQKDLLEGAKMEVFQVPISNCIIVSNLASNVTEDTIKFYFENTKKSGGGTVEKVVMIDSEGACLVYFCDLKVIPNVLKQEHNLSEQKVDVCLYQECLGLPDGERKLRIPGSLIISDTDPHKIKFMLSSTTNRDAIAQQLTKCHGTIQWPSDHTQHISITCTLTDAIADCFKLAKKWNSVAKDTFEVFMNDIVVYQNSVLQDVWECVMKTLKTIQIPNPEAVALFADKKTGWVTVVGVRNVADELFKTIASNIKQITDKAEKEKQKVTETVSNLNTVEIKLLLECKFLTKVKEKFPELNVRANQSRNEIVFDGNYSNVRDAKLLMYEMKASFVISEIQDVSELFLELCTKKETNTYILKKLNPKIATTDMEIINNTLRIYCINKDAIEESIRLIRRCIVEHYISTDNSSKPTLNSRQWNSQVAQWHKSHSGKCIISVQNESEVVVCATDDIADQLHKSVEIFLRQNSLFEESMLFERGIHRLIKTHHNQSIDDIAKNLQKYSVEISYDPSESSLIIRGTKDGIVSARQKIQGLVNKIKKQEHVMKKPGLVEYMQSSNGQDILDTIEKTLMCALDLKGKQYQNLREDPNLTRPATLGNQTMVHATCKAYQTKTIVVAEGDLTELTVDVLVNPVDENMNLLGGIGKVIASKGGPSIRKECQNYIQKNGPLKAGETFMSSGGNLKAKHVIHVIGPEWKGGKQNEDILLREAVFKSLMQASLKQARSIAIPAISCGVLGFPIKQATTIIVKTLNNFLVDQESTITDVYLCDIKRNTVDYFTDALKHEFRDANVTTYDAVPVEENFFRLTSAAVSSNDLYTRHQQLKPADLGIIQIGNINLAVIRGDAANQKVDVIINTTAKNLDLKSGAVSSSLLRFGGDELQKEINAKYPNGIKYGEIAITSGQKLNCKIVIHGSLPHWNESVQKQTNVLHSFMSKCLEESQKLGHASVAFPAMGSGNLGYPKDIVANKMFTAVANFSRNNPNSTVNDVRFIIYPKDTRTIKAFQKEQMCWCGGHHYNSRADRKFVSNKERFRYSNPAEENTKDDYMLGNIRVIVKTGDITMESVGCIVNSTNEDLDLTIGAVSQAIVKKGGQALTKELASKKKEMRDKHLVTTSGHGLPCQLIIHIVAQEQSCDWKDQVRCCLQMAEEQNMSSIAFPALGTSIHVKPAEIAKVMVEAIIEFEKTKPEFLKEVRMVVFHQEMIASFHRALRNARGLSQADSLGREKTMFDLSDPDKATFVLWSMSGDVIKNAVKKLEQLLEKEGYKKVFDDTIICRFTDDLIMEIKAVAKQRHVTIDINKSKGQITIDGLNKNVFEVTDKIFSFMRDASFQESEKNAANLMSNITRWYYMDKTKLVQYEDSANYEIEQSYKKNAKTIELYFTVGKEQRLQKYIIDFIKLKEFNADARYDKVDVIRRDFVKENVIFNPPNMWSNTSDDLSVVTLQTTDQDYIDVASKFKLSSGLQNIVKIERIQNKTLWQQYQAKKKQIESQNPKHQNENFLWHGTASETLDSINAQGFNRSYCGKNATAYGDGVYFAVSAQYSCQDTYSRPNSSGIKWMYYCRVLTGDYAQGIPGMRVPPSKDGAKGALLYDSVVDNIQSPMMYIIFHDTQAYPEYLVSFKR